MFPRQAVAREIYENDYRRPLSSFHGHHTLSRQGRVAPVPKQMICPIMTAMANLLLQTSPMTSTISTPMPGLFLAASPISFWPMVLLANTSPTAGMVAEAYLGSCPLYLGSSPLRQSHL